MAGARGDQTPALAAAALYTAIGSCIPIAFAVGAAVGVLGGMIGLGGVGLGIGVVVAIVLLFGTDIKVAGSLPLAVPLPTSRRGPPRNAVAATDGALRRRLRTARGRSSARVQ